MSTPNTQEEYRQYINELQEKHPTLTREEIEAIIEEELVKRIKGKDI